MLSPACLPGLNLMLDVPAQAPYDVKANYVKREVYIPTRDGVKLFTIIYSPKSSTERYPMLMTRTAYGIGPYGPDAYRPVLGPNNEFAKEGYIFVYQDTRGKFKSEGEFIHHVPIVKGSSKPNESSRGRLVTRTYAGLANQFFRNQSSSARACCTRSVAGSFLASTNFEIV